MQLEQWRNIDGYSGLYEVSDLGRVRSVQRIVPHPRWGNQVIKERILKPGITRNGYSQAHLCKQGQVRQFLIHRLVATAFLNNPLNKGQVNHKSGVKSDNRLVNLEWCSRSENINHRVSINMHGTDKIKKSVLMLDLGTKEVLKSFDSITDAAKYVNGHASNISSVVSRKSKLKSAYGYDWQFRNTN